MDHTSKPYQADTLKRVQPPILEHPWDSDKTWTQQPVMYAAGEQLVVREEHNICIGARHISSKLHVDFGPCQGMAVVISYKCYILADD